MPERTTTVGVAVAAIIYGDDGEPIYTDIRLRWDVSDDEPQKLVLDIRFDAEIPSGDLIVSLDPTDLRRALDMLDALPDESAQQDTSGGES